MTPGQIARLAALVAAQPPGRRVRFHPSYAPEAEGTKWTEWDTSHEVSRIGPDGSRYRIVTYRHADDAAFADEACNALPALLAVLAAKDAEIARLRELVRSVLAACDEGRMVGGGAGGMTIEANIRGSFYNKVPAWPIEEARAALEDTP